jgi:hypothetical protein
VFTASAPYGDRAVEFSPALDHADTGQFGPVLPELSVHAKVSVNVISTLTKSREQTRLNQCPQDDVITA